jgi:hypothetical protein
MLKRLAQLKALSTNEWHVLLSSLVLLPSIALALRLRGYIWTRAFLLRRIPQTSNSSPKPALPTAQSVARMVSVAANYGPYRANCLKRSLATWWLLQRRGIAAELNIGVAKDAGELNAHAWVEYMGSVLVEADDSIGRYSRLGPH